MINFNPLAWSFLVGMALSLTAIQIWVIRDMREDGILSNPFGLPVLILSAAFQIGLALTYWRA